jgi:prolyl oligopeptidase
MRTRHAAPLLLFVLVPALAHCGGEAPPPVPPVPMVATISPPPPVPVPSGPRPPETPKQPVTTTYHGVAVHDDYAWLENGADPKVTGWSDAENAYMRQVVDALPDRPAIKQRIAELIGEDSPGYGEIVARGATLFVMKTQPPKQQGFLVTLASSVDPTTEKVLVDPNVLDPSGKTTIDIFVPSPDGKRVAVSLSRGGSESGDVHIYDVGTGQERVADVVPRVHGGTAGGSLAWAGNTGFYYTRYPHDGERAAADLSFYQQVYFHTLGTPTATDTYAIGKDFPRIAEVELVSSHDGKVVIAKVANGDGGEFALYVHGAGKSTAWTQLSTFADKVVAVEIGQDDSLYLLSHLKARGQILRLSPATAPLAKASVLVPEGDTVIESFVPTATRLYVVDRVGGPSQVRAIPLHGDALHERGAVPIPVVSHVSATARLGGDDLLLRDESYTAPPAWYRYSAKTGTLTKTALFKKTSADFSDAEVLREQCTSKDGTKVPVSLLQKKGASRDGSGYALLTGYGGFNISRAPRFRPLTRLFLDEGLVYAEANLRGGGELGEAWHEAGNLTHKQNVFDDFYGCAKLLESEKVAGPTHLAIQGGSNGGLLMGAELTQHPDAFRVVLAHVGIYDMLHYETTFNGTFNIPEYGTVKDEAQFKALYAYSPFHNVKDGTAYPSVLFLTGANDPRVDPYNSRKMTARLQAATSSANPILLRTSHDTGHGMGTPLAAEIEEDADVSAFMLHELGIKLAPPAGR